MKRNITGNVLSLHLEICGGWEQWILLASDVHFDSVYCNRDLWARHLQLATERNAMIMVFGDLFDAMQGRFDPRRSMKELRPEYRRDDYYDFVVKDLAEFLEPYAKQITLLARGNHETSILKNANTDLMDRLVFAINTQYGAGAVNGAGSEAPVTRGVIQTNRQAVYLPDADIVVNGHNHSNYYVPISRERISNKGVLHFDIQHHIRIPGYKQDYADGSGGWTVERGGVPKPIGAVWMRLYYEQKAVRLQFVPDLVGPSPCEPVGYGNDDDWRPFPQDHG
jgi:hypothetical protein